MISFGNDRHSMVCHHTVVLLAPQSPNRKKSLHFGLFNKRVDHTINAVGHYDSVERMCSTISVPAREGRVEVAALCLYNLVIGVAVHSVDIGYLVGLYQSVIE